jgi:VWFA-related protein
VDAGTRSDTLSRRLKQAVAAAIALLSLAAHQAPPQPPPVFRSGITLIEVDVAVLDGARRPVRGLSAADFTILEDGVPQEIQTFAAVELPAPPATRWMREIAPDVRSNRPREGRLIAIVLDDGQMWFDMVPRAKESARRVIDALGPGDLAAVIFTKDNSRSQEFTEDRSLLHAAVEGLHEGATRRSLPQPSVEAGGAGPRAAAPQFTPDSGDTAPQLWQKTSLSVLGGVANAMADVPKRRKAIVYVSGGVPVSPRPMDPLRTEQDQSILEAKRANVPFYPIDPYANPYLARQTLQQESLAALAGETGGFVTGDRGNLASAVANLMAETSSYYLLGYQSPRMEADGKLRAVTVKVNRADVRVQARTGYSPRKARGAAEVAIRPEVAGAAAKSDIEIQAFAAPFRKPGQSGATLALVLGLRQLAPPGSSLKEKLDLDVAAYANQGRRKASNRETYQYTLRAEGEEIAYEVFSKLDLEPGTYLVRVNAASGAQDRSGVAYYDVEVPDFSKLALSLSGLVLTADPAAPVVGKDRFAAILPVNPTANREFDAASRVGAFVRIYLARKAGAPVVTASIMDGAGREVFAARETLDAGRFAAENAADYRLELPMRRLALGPHLLTIEARLSEKDFARRALRFEVVP